MATLIDVFYSFKNNAKNALISYDENHKINKKYKWFEYVNESIKFCNSIKNIQGNVAIHSFNCPEWFFSAMGTILSGKIICGIYNTNNSEQCMHIIRTGSCKVLVVESFELYKKKYIEIEQELIDLDIQIVIINKNDTDNLELKQNMIYWSDYLKSSSNMYKRPENLNENTIISLIFTSGTTSNPKGVQLTHKNIISSVYGVMDMLDIKDERIVSYLPLSHVAAQVLDIYTHIFHGGEVHFARSDALTGSLKKTLNLAKPTIFLGVPRVWEKFKEAMMLVAAERYVGVKGTILKYFMDFVKSTIFKYHTQKTLLSIILYPICSRIVNKIKEQIGLDKCKYYVTGAAPISKDVLSYFMSIDIPIMEIYGMSETSAVITISNPQSSLNGSCGKSIKNSNIKIDPNTNEILVKGPQVFNGYYNYDGPNDIDEEGYLHTGDCGEIKDEYLYITGRIKELIITAGGENIPPVIIENKLINIQNKMESIMLIGDKRKYLSLLIFDQNNKLSEKEIDDAIKIYNQKSISNAQKIQKFTIIHDTPTIENGCLTPTMKLKRKFVENKYINEIEKMYSDNESKI